MRRRQRRMKVNPSGPSGLALQGASALLRGLGVESTTPSAARLASAPLQSQRGSRGILRQAPSMAANPPARAKAVIVGGGVIGCSVAYHLSKMGWGDIVLL